MHLAWQVDRLRTPKTLVDFCQITPVTEPRVPEVLFQAHSRNDDREWRQMVLKGAINLKLDVHFVEGELCGHQTRQVRTL